MWERERERVVQLWLRVVDDYWKIVRVQNRTSLNKLVRRCSEAIEQLKMLANDCTGLHGVNRFEQRDAPVWTESCIGLNRIPSNRTGLDEVAPDWTGLYRVVEDRKWSQMVALKPPEIRETGWWCARERHIKISLERGWWRLNFWNGTTGVTMPFDCAHRSKISTPFEWSRIRLQIQSIHFACLEALKWKWSRRANRLAFGIWIADASRAFGSKAELKQIVKTLSPFCKRLSLLLYICRSFGCSSFGCSPNGPTRCLLIWPF